MNVFLDLTHQKMIAKLSYYSEARGIVLEA